MLLKEEKQAEMAKNLNTAHLDFLKKALDTAVNISARKNVPPLPVSLTIDEFLFASKIVKTSFLGHFYSSLRLRPGVDGQVQPGQGPLTERSHRQRLYTALLPDGSPGNRVWTSRPLL